VRTVSSSRQFRVGLPFGRQIRSIETWRLGLRTSNPLPMIRNAAQESLRRLGKQGKCSGAGISCRSQWLSVNALWHIARAAKRAEGATKGEAGGKVGTSSLSDLTRRLGQC